MLNPFLIGLSPIPSEPEIPFESFHPDEDIKRGSGDDRTRMKFNKRLHALQIIYNYLKRKHFDRLEVTAADIVRFYKLPPKFSYSLAATMRYVHDRKKAIYGFRVAGVRGFRKEGYPTKYTIGMVKDKKVNCL
jgi:hypothetical protein